jgi:hypothetical protein
MVFADGSTDNSSLYVGIIVAIGGVATGVLGTVFTFWMKRADQRAKLEGEAADRRNKAEAEAEERIARLGGSAYTALSSLLNDVRTELSSVKGTLEDVRCELDTSREEHRKCLDRSAKLGMAIMLLQDHNKAQDAILGELGFQIPPTPLPKGLVLPPIPPAQLLGTDETTT